MIASTDILESRIKLWYGKERNLSVQFPLECNFLTEGCHGGFAYEYGLFLESYYTVAEEDAPYEATSEVNKCKMYENAKPVASVEKSYYVGGGYG